MKKESTHLPPAPVSQFKIIPLDLIDDPERPVRSDLSPESVEDLVLSIRQVGIIEPLVVKPRGERYEVIAGHRRLVAATIADLAQAPCYIVNADKTQTELLKIHENLYRANIRPSDEAEHFKYLIEKHKLSPVRIAKLISRSQNYVSERLMILNYPPELKHAMDSGQITYSVAREFNRMADLTKMKEYLHYAIRNGITPLLARQWVIDYNRASQQRPTEPVSDDRGVAPSEQIEHTSKCIYCQKPIKLSEANVVYIHDRCLQEADKPIVATSTE